MQVSASIKDKDKRWYLGIDYRLVADFETFEELDGMVPVLVNGYLNRSDE